MWIAWNIATVGPLVREVVHETDTIYWVDWASLRTIWLLRSDVIAEADTEEECRCRAYAVLKVLSCG